MNKANDRIVPLSDLIGKRLRSIRNIQDQEIEFITVDNEVYRLYHQDDCCESVSIVDISGELEDLLGKPIVMAEEVSDDDYEEQNKNEYEVESETWTFYKFATINGYVTIRWYGTSNGYYSESVSFFKSE